MSFDLSNYTLLNKIGCGEFGEVYKVQDKTSGSIHAAKISTKTIDERDEEFQKNFEREVSIISKVHHPSILKFIGISQTDFKGEDKPVIVTDFLSNGSLEDILVLSHRGCPPEQWNDTLKLINIYGIARAMSFLHSHNIIHRDLKPANILLNQYLFPVIADFGLSKDVDTTNSQSGIKGTPLYIAPEVWEEVNYSNEADVFAYAMILYEIYSNQKPFRNITMYKLAQAICKGIRPDTSDIEEPYKDLIERCWSQEPSDRPTFDEIVNALENNHDFITDLVEEDDFRKYIDFINKSPNSVDEKVDVLDFKIDGTKVIKKVNLVKKKILSEEQYAELTKSGKKLVDKAIDDPNKQYEVGYNLVYGNDDFPNDPKTGVKYLKKAIKGGSIKAVILYNRLLIIGKKIDQDLTKAKENLQNYDDLNEPEIIFLQSMIAKKEENYVKSVKLLKKAIRGKCGEAMFEYGKMLYLGEGEIEKNKKEAMKLFNKAKENGCDKVDKFLKKQKEDPEPEPIPAKKTKKEKKKYNKKIDLVILVDGTNSNKYFYEAIKETFEQIAKEIIEGNPTVRFRFGAIMYRDMAFSVFAKMDKRKTPFFNDLTDDIEKTQEFLDKSSVKFGSIKYPSDWESGYFAVLNKMNWDEEAEKVVVHMTHIPSHGTNYAIKNKWYRKYFRMPKFNEDSKKNFQVFKRMQDESKKNIYSKIVQLTKKGIKFYCLNGNEVSLFCFRKVKNAFIKNGGEKFLIKDLFGYTYKGNGRNDDDDDDEEDLDMEELKDQIDDFFSNVIQDCVSNDDSNGFERKCNQRFITDLKKFYKNNGCEFHDKTETETETDDEGLFVNDADDDDDDDDESQKEEENPIKKSKSKTKYSEDKSAKTKRSALSEKTKSTPIIQKATKTQSKKKDGKKK